MSKGAAAMHAALKKIFDNGAEVLVAEVISVDKAACTCDVMYDEDLEIGGVRLRAVEDEVIKGFKLFPKIGSCVLIQRLGDDEDHFITMYSEIESIAIDIEGSSLEINAGGFKLDKGVNKFKDVMDDLFGQVKALNNEVQKIVVAIGVTPNVPALQGINVQIDNNRAKANEILK